MKHQSGRSMVEILGVLAIIGVLSVGGLAAYNYAMDKKVVNDLMYDMELATTEIWTSGTTGSGDLGEEMDVSVLGENHPNITVRKLQHVENGEIVLDEADGEIMEEDVAAVENGEEPAFSIEIHDITVAQCVQLLRNQDKLNTPFLLEDSDGNVFDPENGDDPQDFCERIFGKDDPVAFGLISNAYAKRGGALLIFHREKPEEKRPSKFCPGGSKWIATNIGEDEEWTMVPYTYSKGYACFCPDNNPVWNGTQCVSCPTGTKWKKFSEEDTGKDYFESRGYDPATYSSWRDDAGYINRRGCFCPEENPVWHNGEKKCTRCPYYVSQWITTTQGKKEKRGYDPATESNGYACHCFDDDPVWHRGIGCTDCPDGTDWMSLEEGKGKEFVDDTYSNGYACHYCPAENPVWDNVNKKCTRCPDGTDWMSREEGKKEKRAYIWDTISNDYDYACHCPRENPVWHRYEKRCTVCPDGTDWLTDKEGEGRGYVDGTYLPGYSTHACYCPPENPIWDGTQCVYCPTGTEWKAVEEGAGREYDPATYSNDYACHYCKEGQISDGKGHCCDLETGEGCKCTLDYLENKYKKCGEDCDWEKEILENYLEDIVLVVDGEGLVRYSKTYGRKGTCATDQCAEALWCDVGIEGACCPCEHLYDKKNNLVNNGECNYCPKGSISGYTREQLETKRLEAADREEEVKVESIPPNFTGGICLECADYGGVWVPGSEDESSVAYTRDSSCVFCPKNRPKWNGDDKKCEKCPNGAPKWDGDSCEPCPEKTYWDGDKCVPCYQYGDETPYWNDASKQCEKCPDQTPAWNDASKQCVECPKYNPVWNGNKCVTCYDLHGGGYPYWNGKECVACAYDPNSGGVVWDNGRGACVSCYDAYEDETPVWDGYNNCVTCYQSDPGKPLWNGKECIPCPDGYYWNPDMKMCG